MLETSNAIELEGRMVCRELWKISFTFAVGGRIFLSSTTNLISL